MNVYAAINFDALGLRDHSPFAILSRPCAKPKASTAPKKRGPKALTKTQRAARALETPEETEIRLAAGKAAGRRTEASSQ